jgi:hypothetical protein
MSNTTVESIECCICYEQIEAKNNCTTPCGHTFCFVCMMKSLNTNNTCPCCRAVLKEEEEEEEDLSDEDEEEDDDDEYMDDYHERNSVASAKKISEQFEKMGYTMEDIITMYLDRIDSSNNRATGEFIEKINKEFHDIVEAADTEAEKEHNEKFDMMEEDTRRHNRPLRTILNIDLEFNIIGL